MQTSLLSISRVFFICGFILSSTSYGQQGNLEDWLSQARGVLASEFLENNNQLALKIIMLCDGAVAKFGKVSFSGVDVLNRLLGVTKPSLPEVTFSHYKQFQSWYQGQNRAILLLYDRENIGSVVCELYLEHLVKLGKDIVIIRAFYDDFIEHVADKQPAGHAELYPLSVVPDVIMVMDGALWQLSQEDALVRLKAGIDRFVYGLN